MLKGKKERHIKLLAKQGSFKGGQSSNYLDKTGGTSLGKLIKMAFSLGSQLLLEMRVHLLFDVFKYFKYSPTQTRGDFPQQQIIRCLDLRQ